MSEATSLPSVPICGLKVLALNSREVLDELCARIERGEAGRIVTLNVEMLARAQRDPQYAEWLRTADIIVPDGMPIVWASRRKLRTRKLYRVTGVDLTVALLKRVDPKWIGVLGGKDPIAALKRVNLPNPDLVRINNEYLDPNEATFDACADQMAERRLIFLALGVPKQDAFAVALRARLPHTTLIPNGGSFELIAGITPRAPRWMQRSGLEWLFRLCVEPRRLWRRYLVEYWSGVFALWSDLKNREAISPTVHTTL